MTRGAALTVGFVAALTAGCGVPLEANFQPTPVNTCSSDDACGEGASCTLSGVCAATTYDLGGMLLEVRPNGGAVFGGNMSFLVDPVASAGISLVSSAATTTSFFTPFTFNLVAPVALHGTVLPNPATPLGASCVLPGGTLPASLTFYRLPRLGSLSFDPVTANAVYDGVSENAFDVQLVSDDVDQYDVYIEPAAVTGCPTFPPYFVPGQHITANDTVWTLPPIGKLSGTLGDLAELDSWQVDLVEPTRGLPISAPSALMPAVGAKGAAVNASISSLASVQSAILRLTPLAPTPTDAHATDPTRPTVYWTLQGAISGGTKENPEVQFDLSDLSTAPVQVDGTIVVAGGVTPSPSLLTIQSLTLNGNDAGNAAYSNDAVSAVDKGAFSVLLPPGSYLIRAVPVTDNNLAITDIPLEVPLGASMTGCVCGLTFPEQLKPTLHNTIITSQGDALAGTTVAFSPSQTPARSYLANTHSLPPLPTRFESTTTDKSGGFSLLVDPGTADLIVQPDPSTNLPWLVVPQVSAVTGPDTTPLALKSPAFLGGTVRDPQGLPVANAEIDVWYPVRDRANPSVLTGAVVKIATTSTGADGTYTLVLPSSI